MKDNVHRKRRLILAYLTTGGSKILGLLSQLLALPIVSSVLPAEQLGAMFVLAALASFICIPAQGFSSAISFVLSDRRGRGESEEARRNFWAMLAIAGVSAIAVLLLGLLALAFVDPAPLIGAQASSMTSELKWSFAALTIHVTAYYLFWFAEGARAAYQENHISNLFAAASSIATLAITWLVSQFAPSIGAFYIAIFAIPSMFQGLSLISMMFGRRGEFGRPVFDRRRAKDIWIRALSYSQAQVGNNLYLHGTVFVSGHLIGLNASALVGAVVRLLVLVHSSLLSLLVPLLPTLSFGLASKDIAWVVRLLRATTALTVAVPLALGIMLSLGGAWFFRIWLGLAFPEPSLLAFTIGLMSTAFMASHLIYMILTALGDPTWGSKRILLAGLLGSSSGAVGASIGGLTPLIAAQGLAMLTLAMAPLYLRLRRRAAGLARQATSQAA